MKALERILIAFLLAVLIAVAIEFFFLFRALAHEVPAVDKTLIAVQAVEVNTTRTEAELAGLLNATRHIALDEQKAQQDQLAAVQQLAARSSRLVDDADVAVKEFGDSAQALGAIGPSVEAAVGGLQADSHDTLEASQDLLRQATADLADSSIHESLNNVDSATANVAQATATAAHAMQTVDDTVSAEAKIILAPASKVKRAALFAASILGHLLGI